MRCPVGPDTGPPSPHRHHHQGITTSTTNNPPKSSNISTFNTLTSGDFPASRHLLEKNWSTATTSTSSRFGLVQTPKRERRKLGFASFWDRSWPNCLSAAKRKLKWSPPPDLGDSATDADSGTNTTLSSSTSSSTRRMRCSRCCRHIIGGAAMGTMVCRGGMKLKERLLVGVSAATVLFTLLLVVDLQMDAGMVGHHLVPNHARVKVGSVDDPNGAVYNGFRNRLLQKTHGYDYFFNFILIF